jgi:pimeloyl-ACP methyl ester carboxylesterase
MKWNHHTAELGDISLHYVAESSGELILFLHGFPQFWYEWKDQLPEFGRDHRAVAPDMRGYNLSSKPDAVDAYTIPILCQDILSLIEHLGHDRCILVAHDWGGVIAWSLAGRRPDLVEKLLIINCPHPAIFQRELQSNPDQQKASQYFNLFRSDTGADTLLRNDCAALRRMLLRKGLSDGYFDKQDEQMYVEAWTQPEAIQSGLNYYRNLPLSPDTAETASMEGAFCEAFPELKIRVPTKVIWAENDPAMVIDNLNGLDEYVPELTIDRIPKASHWVPNEQSARVNTSIRAFIGESD